MSGRPADAGEAAHRRRRGCAPARLRTGGGEAAHRRRRGSRLRTGGVERTPSANEEKDIMRRGLKRKAVKVIVVWPREG